MNYYQSEGRIEELESLLSRRVIQDTTSKTGGGRRTQTFQASAVPTLPYTQCNQEPDYDYLNFIGGQK